MNIYTPGTIIADRYLVASQPLMGGMGIVYLCLDGKEERPVAIKTFRPEFLPDRRARDRFLRESTAWVNLGSHPHIVRCYNVKYIDPTAFLVLELVAKDQDRRDASLRSWLIPGQSLPVEQSLVFALQICRGMEHATDTLTGFVHRDLKPENVLVGADRLKETNINRLRVTDFGLVHILEDSNKSETENNNKDLSISERDQPASPIGRTLITHGISGTPLYMAPEQWHGEPVSVATDVYALGCILYEMISGSKVVQGTTLHDLELGHCSEKKGLESERYPDCVRSLVQRCIAVDPKERFNDWEQVIENVEKVYSEVAHKSAPVAEKSSEQNLEERVAGGWSYDAIGMSYRDIGKSRVAIGYFQRAEEVGKREGDRGLERAALAGLGVTYQDLGEMQSAIGFLEKALVINHDLVDQRWYEGMLMNNLGNTYFKMGKVQRAIEYHQQALIIVHEVGNRHGEASALSGLGNSYSILGELQRAIEYYEQALVIDREIGDRRSEGAILSDLGIAYKNLDNPRRAIWYQEQSLAIKREIGDRSGEGTTLGNLGEAYRILGDLHRAIDYYEQRLIIARETSDRRGEGYALGNLGIAYDTLGEVQRAIGYYEQALVIRKEIGDANGIALDSFNMGMLYRQLGEVEKALPLVQVAAEIWQRMGIQEKAQNAQRVVDQLLEKGTASASRTSVKILKQFATLIDAAVAAAQGNRQAHTAMEAAFDQLEQQGWHIAEPIRCIWEGERDQATLVQGLDESDTLIVSEVLKHLK